MNAEQLLTLIKVAHTAIWAGLATGIGMLPIIAIRGHFRLAGWLTAPIVAECLMLPLDGGR